MDATSKGIPQTMLAVRLHGAGDDRIFIERVPVPRPGEGQLLARVEAAGVCTSLLKMIAQGSEHALIRGWDLETFPAILGDEGCVTVVEAGKAVAARYPVGTRYAIQPAVEHPPINNRERYAKAAEGMHRVAVGYTLPGHLAQYMLVPEEVLAAGCLLPLPSPDIPSFAGALCEPFSCVLSAQTRHVHLLQDSPASPRVPRLGFLERGVAMVIGAGPMGRMHAEAALRFRPRHLIVADIAAPRLAWLDEHLPARARAAGARVHAVSPDLIPEVLRSASDGRGADDIVVAVGHRGVQIEAQGWLAPGGVLNLFGGLKRGEHVIDLDTLRVHYDEIRVVGSSGGSPADMAEALRMTAAGEFDPGNHLSLVGSLDQFPRALEMIRKTETEGKIVLYPHIAPTPLTPTVRWGRVEEEQFLRGRSL